jgi:hypothetical protein
MDGSWPMLLVDPCCWCWLVVVGGVGNVGVLFLLVCLSQCYGGNRIDHATGRSKLRLILITVEISLNSNIRDGASNHDLIQGRGSVDAMCWF